MKVGRIFQFGLICLVLSYASLSWSGLWGDINGDEKIGLEEAVYALQVASGIKTPRVNATHTGTIDTDEIWTPEGNPHIVSKTLTIAGYSPNGATLTIEPGVEVRFEQNAKIVVGDNNSPATLIAKGTETSRIVFTGNQTEKTRGWWYHVYFNEQAVNCQMAYCTVEYGGKADIYSNGGNIIIDKAENVVIENCVITNSATNGLRFDTAYSSDISTGSAKLSSNKFSDNEYCGIELCTANHVRWIEADNRFIGNKSGGIYVNGSHTDSLVTHDAAWHKFDEPYIVENTIVEGATLTIEPGAELRFTEGAMLDVKSGRLVAEGTSGSHILFTSSQAYPTKGWWEGIYLKENAADSSLAYCTVEYGGKPTPFISTTWIKANIAVQTKNGLNIHNCIIKNSEGHGVEIRGEYLTNGALAEFYRYFLQ